jgi:signal-transduction protein with cAMP-binding, CBS, and nucleotidyltransferase domain
MSSTEKLLARVPLFKALEAQDFGRLAAVSHVETFSPGGTIVSVGEPGRSLCLVTEGHVQVLYPVRTEEVERAGLGA